MRVLCRPFFVMFFDISGTDDDGHLESLADIDVWMLVDEGFVVISY